MEEHGPRYMLPVVQLLSAGLGGAGNREALLTQLPAPAWGGQAHRGRGPQRSAPGCPGRAALALLAPPCPGTPRGPFLSPFLLAPVKAKIWDPGLDSLPLCALLASRPQPILPPAPFSALVVPSAPCFPSLLNPSLHTSPHLRFPLGFAPQKEIPVVLNEHKNLSGTYVRGQGEGP